MYIEIHLNADELTDQDRAILTAIGNAGASFGVTRETAAEEAPKKRAPRKSKAEPKEEVAAPEEKVETARAYTEEEEQAALDEAHRQAAEEEPKETPTLDEVANVATAFIRNGKRDEIAKILNEDLGVEKVTALKDSPEKVPELLDLLVNFYNELKSDETRKAVRQQINADTAPLFLARTEA